MSEARFQCGVEVTFNAAPGICLNPEMLVDIETHAERLCWQLGARLIGFEGDRQSVVLTIAFRPATSISKVVNSLKTVTARLVRRDHLRDVTQNASLWEYGYSARTVEV